MGKGSYDHRFEEALDDDDEKGAIHNMSEWLDRVESRAVARGKAQGMVQGMAQGMAQGKEEKAREMARSLYGMGMKPEQIAQVANEPIGKVRQWLGLASEG